MKVSLIFVLWGLCTLGSVWSQEPIHPTKAHVKMVNGNAVKYTSRLTKVIELNFTMGFHHADGKPIISNALASAAQKEGFTVTKFVGGTDGTSNGQLPDFTLNDLTQGEVIFANNISAFGDGRLGNVRRQAIEDAIKVEGLGYLGWHASGDYEGNDWSFFVNELHPMDYGGHANNDEAARVYKWEANKNHIVLDGLLETNTLTSGGAGDNLNGVLMGVDGNGNEILAEGVPYRMMRNEWYRFGRDIRDEPEFQDKITQLLSYDYRPLSTGNALGTDYRFKGGNMYNFILQVGEGKASYMPPGHDQFDLNNTTSNSFDGGTGDLELHTTHLVYYLAGYTPSVCGTDVPNPCDGLRIVDDNDLLTGEEFAVTDILSKKWGDRWPEISITDAGISVNAKDNYSVTISGANGKKVLSKNLTGIFDYQASDLSPGIYLVTVDVPGIRHKTGRLLKL